MQRGLRGITLQGALEKSPILLSQYWNLEWLDGTIIISYFGGSNNIFVHCICLAWWIIINEHLIDTFYNRERFKKWR